MLDGAAADPVNSLFQVLPQVLDVLEADAEANQGRRHPKNQVLGERTDCRSEPETE
ncbi:MAG: hypothetical protein M3460_12510 [Actinomycetota bacterium]|nr:hypothetical protein [Actinomycetota bacterium]